MKINTIKSNVKTVGLGLILAGGFALVSVTNGNAQAAPPRPDAPPPARDAKSPRPDAPPPMRGAKPPRPDAPPMMGDPLRDGAGDDAYAPAREQGMRDGQLKGTEDRADNDEFKPEKASRYKKGTNGYSRNFGSKDEYRAAYRQGFLRGYERAYKDEMPGMPNNSMNGERPAPPMPLPADAPRPDGRPMPPPRDGKRPKPPVKKGDRRDAPPPPADPNSPPPADADKPQPAPPSL